MRNMVGLPINLDGERTLPISGVTFELHLTLSTIDPDRVFELYLTSGLCQTPEIGFLADST